MADLNALIAQGAQFNMPDQLGQYAKMQQLQAGQQQMRTAGLQEQTAGMQLEQLKQDRDNMAKLSQQLSVKGIGPRQYFEALQTSGDPKHQQLGIEGLMKLDQTEKYDAFLKSQQTIPAGQAPAPMAGGLGSGTFGMDNLPGMPTPSNALAPRAAAPMASTNALAPKTANSVAAIKADMQALMPYVKAGAEGAKEAMDLLKEDYKRLNALHVVGGNLVTGAGDVAYTGAEKTAAPTTLSRLQTELAALPPNDPRRAEYINAIRKETQFAPQASTTINMPPQEKAEQGARGNLLVKEYSDVSGAAKLAAKILPSIDANLNILNNGFKTGFGTESIAAGASVLAALGVPNAEKFATNAQTFLGSATQAVLQKQLEQKGPQTESDAKRIEQTGAQLGNTVQANQFMLSTAKAQLKRDMEQRNFYDSWWKKNKTYDGAEDAWFNGEGGKSLFDRPELKQYKEPTKADAAAASARPSLNTIFGGRR
jgi:hypothetical protein